MGNQVEKVKTDVSLPALVNSFARAWQSLLSRKPSKEQLAMFVSQNSLETGNRKAMYNYNIGNVIAGNSGYDYFLGDDTNKGKHIVQHFRAYKTLDEGVLDYLKILYRGYPQAFQAANTGDPKNYAHSLLENPKRQYYDATVEKSYAAGMNRLYSQYMKSSEFDQAYRNAVGNDASVQEPNRMVATKDNKQQSTPQQGGGFMAVVDAFLKQIAASEKQVYQKYLPANHMVIQVQAGSVTDSVEFSRILCAALDEELQAQSFTHTDGDMVEIECTINGPEQICFAAVKQLTAAISDAFKQATSKIGGIEVKTQFISNKKSSYQQINYKFASNQHRKFLLKFV